jgi:hypothetical protein
LRLLTHEQADAGPIEARRGRAHAEQREGAAARRGLLAAVEVELEVGAQLGAERVRAGERQAEPALADLPAEVGVREPGRILGRDDERRDVGVVDAGVGVEAVDEHQARQLHAVAQAGLHLRLVLLLELAL